MAMRERERLGSTLPMFPRVDDRLEGRMIITTAWMKCRSNARLVDGFLAVTPCKDFERHLA
jgi:hypothetical protein